MNLSFILLLAFFGAASSQKLNQAENNDLQRICGTQPRWPSKRFVDKSLDSLIDSNSTRRNIYNGIPTVGSKAPWSVRVFFGQMKCSATIISRRHVLTARHCLEMSPWKSSILQGALYHADSTSQVYSGTFPDLSVNFPNGERAAGSVVALYLIDSLYKTTLEVDLLILELNTDLPLTATSFPVCVPKNTQENRIGKQVHIYSYGGNVYDVDSGEGSGTLRYGTMKFSGIFYNRSRFQVYDKKFSTRPGDSGGGFLQDYNGRIHVVGVVQGGDAERSEGPLVGYYYNDICRLTGIC